MIPRLPCLFNYQQSDNPEFTEEIFMRLILRNYQSSDHDALALLFYQIRKDEFYWTDLEQLSVSDFDHSIEGERIIVAEAQGRIAGFLSVWEPDKFIHNLFVAKEFRRAGVGRALIRMALSEYGTPLTLKCVAKNETALRFYAKNGWQVEQEDSGKEGAYYLLSLGRAK